jgi:hypothetical protein
VSAFRAITRRLPFHIGHLRRPEPLVSIGDAGRWDRRVFQPYYCLRRFWLQEA